MCVYLYVCVWCVCVCVWCVCDVCVCVCVYLYVCVWCVCVCGVCVVCVCVCAEHVTLLSFVEFVDTGDVRKHLFYLTSSQ